ncbi:MAG: tRNA (adenosine(37)-N6)-dimethylallyltransferase MiaA [Myxococcales bacterium]|nr:tRNA (adenosine(37)-N6)-dimethylallyltransferase MiaA [Myxococcales bacterium]
MHDDGHHGRFGGPLLVIAGPTATGKSQFALQLARGRPIEIVGADSVQVYRGLDIGSGKVGAAEREGVPHHLIDVVEPDRPFTAGDYERCAVEAVAAIHRRGRLPLVVGGTGLYLRALLYGLSEMPSVSDAVRDGLRRELERRGLPALRAELELVDPDWARRIDSNDRQRTLRGLEVYRATGEPLSALQARDRPTTIRYDALVLGLDVETKALQSAIERRVDEMLAAGLVEEVRGLLDRGFDPSLKSMQSLGYRQICEHLAGRCDLAAARSAIVREHQRYAKRQRTWFRKVSGLQWVPPAIARIGAVVEPFLAKTRCAPQR